MGSACTFLKKFQKKVLKDTNVDYNNDKGVTFTVSLTYDLKTDTERRISMLAIIKLFFIHSQDPEIKKVSDKMLDQKSNFYKRML